MTLWSVANFESEIQMTLFRNDLTMRELLAIAAALGESGKSELSPQEYSLVQELPSAPADLVSTYQNRIRAGEDPLGDSFCELLSPQQRRPLGATYTPQPIVDAMVGWAVGMASPSRVIDAGCGSGRFLVAAAHRFKSAQLVGVEVDPAGALLARANLAAWGLANRSSITVGDFRSAPMPSIDGQTLFIGNPPYIRHHLIDSHWKNWFVNSARDHGVRASQLAGMHVHFYIATLNAAKAGDVGVLITAAEWLDVNYGKALRELLLGELGGCNIQVIEPVAMPFPDAAATAAITGFEIGRQTQAIGFRRVDRLPNLGALETDHMVPAETLRAARRWTPLTRSIPEASTDLIELGELFRVHRGQVTGANKIWIEGAHTKMLPDRVMFRSITRAKELFSANGARLDDSLFLKRVIDLPVDLGECDAEERQAIDAFLAFAKNNGADAGFIARHRKAWWSVGLRDPAPILATYMARRPPAFVRNVSQARHINVAHGLYPRQTLSDATLSAVVRYLASEVSTNSGRTYAGGLTKFEPREMERLLIPTPAVLEQ